MKICYINPTFLIRRPIADLIDQLGNTNEIGLFVPKKPFEKVDQSWHSNNALSKSKIYSYSAINLPFINFEWPIPVTPMFIINLLRVYSRYTIIHLWTYFYINSITTIFFKLFFPRTKLILTCDTFPAYSFSSGKVVDFLFLLYTKSLGWFFFGVPDRIHLYSQSIVELARKAGINAKKIVVLPTGINLKKFQNSTNIRSELGFKEQDLILVYAGLIVPRKGIDIMLKTLKLIKNKNVKLLLVGDGPNKKKYQEMALELGISNKVTFLGWRKDVASIFKSSNVLFLPSRGEGLPGVVMEAMACGLPVIASDIPCIPDLVEDRKSGFLCKMEDISCFAKKIEELVKNRNLMKNMKAEGLRKISTLGWEALQLSYLEMYRGSE